jgi:hypothetical protein
MTAEGTPYRQFPDTEYSVLQDAREVVHQAVDRLFGLKHVVACGLGFKVSQGQQTDELSLVVSVTHKMPPTELDRRDLIPRAFGGLVTDVVETGAFRAMRPPRVPLSPRPRVIASADTEDPRVRRRPAQPGCSIGHRDITAGTFGLLVQRDGAAYILSNNHVLANSNAAHIGDPIYQPGAADGGRHDDKLAALIEFEPLDFGEAQAECSTAKTLAHLLNLLAQLTGSSHRLEPVMMTTGLNVMDAALALPDQPDWVIPDILRIGIPTGIAEPALGQIVQKMGRTTELTKGIVTQIDVTVDVDYAGRKARFTDQVFAGPISSPGDSGSSILDTAGRVVGLLFAGSEQVTIFTPIRRILDRFGVDVIIA